MALFLINYVCATWNYFWRTKICSMWQFHAVQFKRKKNHTKGGEIGNCLWRTDQVSATVLKTKQWKFIGIFIAVVFFICCNTWDEILGLWMLCKWHPQFLLYRDRTLLCTLDWPQIHHPFTDLLNVEITETPRQRDLRQLSQFIPREDNCCISGQMIHCDSHHMLEGIYSHHLPTSFLQVCRAAWLPMVLMDTVVTTAKWHSSCTSFSVVRTECRKLVALWVLFRFIVLELLRISNRMDGTMLGARVRSCDYYQ